MGTWPGYFISFEGLDGAGKSTQVASLAGTLRVTKRDVLTVRPNNTRLGEILHSFVLQHQRGPTLSPWAEALLFTAERVQLLDEVILPALHRGAIVIADRYADSTLAYQGGGRGLSLDALRDLHRAACGDVWPDLTFYLRIPAAVAQQRQHAQQLPLDRIEGSPEDFHQHVERTFEALAEADPQRIARVDATGSAIAVSREIGEIALRRLEARAAHHPEPAAAPA